MKKSTKIISGASALAIVAVTVATTGSVFAYQGDPSAHGPNYTPERHEAMEKIFENGDYDAWAKQMEGKGRVTEMITKDNFSKFAQMHELAEKGDMEGAQKIMEELGLGHRMMNGEGFRRGNRGGALHRGMGMMR